MGATEKRSGRAGAAPFDMARGFRWAAAVAAALVLAQALLAGRGWFVAPGLIRIHGSVGNATVLAVVAQLAVAYAGRRQGVVGRPEVGLSALLLALVVAQLGLGYGGRESATAASWHVPNGVLIFGVTAAVLALAPGRGSNAARARSAAGAEEAGR